MSLRKEESSVDGTKGVVEDDTERLVSVAEDSVVGSIGIGSKRLTRTTEGEVVVSGTETTESSGDEGESGGGGGGGELERKVASSTTVVASSTESTGERKVSPVTVITETVAPEPLEDEKPATDAVEQLSRDTSTVEDSARDSAFAPLESPTSEEEAQFVVDWNGSDGLEAFAMKETSEDCDSPSSGLSGAKVVLEVVQAGFAPPKTIKDGKSIGEEAQQEAAAAFLQDLGKEDKDTKLAPGTVLSTTSPEEANIMEELKREMERLKEALRAEKAEHAEVLLKYERAEKAHDVVGRSHPGRPMGTRDFPPKEIPPIHGPVSCIDTVRREVAVMESILAAEKEARQYSEKRLKHICWLVEMS